MLSLIERPWRLRIIHQPRSRFVSVCEIGAGHETSLQGVFLLFGSFSLQRLKEFIAPIVRLAKYALTVQRDDKDAELNEEFSEEERKPLLANAQRFMSPGVFGAIQQELPPHLFSRSTSLEPQNWNEEFRGMNLPPFSMQYIQLVHVPLDVMRECLRLQVELDKDLHSPSPHTIKQVRKDSGKGTVGHVETKRDIDDSRCRGG